MSTDTLAPESSVTVPTARLTGLAVTMPRVIKSEWIKFRTVRSTVITVLAGVFIIIALGALAAAVASGAVAQPTGPGGGGGGGFANGSDPTATSLAGSVLAQLIFAVVGVLAITNEFSNGMIRTYFAAVPQRLPVLWAKVIVVGVLVSVVSVLASFVAFFLGQAIMSSGVTPADPGVLRAVIGSGLYLGGIAVLGVAVGSLLRHTAGTISLLIASLVIIPQLIGALLPSSWVDTITPYLPSNAGAAFTSVTPTGSLLSSGAGAAVFVAWIVVLLGVAAWRMQHKDA